MVRRRAILALLSLSLASALAEDWPCWRGPRQDGTWNAPPLPNAWPEAGPEVVWKAPVGAGYSGIAVADGRVWTMDRPKPTDKSQTPDGTERVLAWDVETGELLWTHEYPAHYGDLDYGSGPRANPTVHEGRVYTLGAVGMACSLDAGTGKVLWQRDLRAEEGATIPMWGLAGSPLIIGETVVLHAGLPNGSVVALDRATGKERWRSISDPAGYATPLLVRAPSGPQLVVWTPENVRGIDSTKGDLFWTIPYRVTYGVSIATPISVGHRVFVSGYWEGSKGIELGPSPTDARLAYEENRELRGLMCPPLTRDGRGFLLDKQFGLTCFDLATGKKYWDDGNQMTPKGRNPQASIVWTGTDRRVLALNSDGELILAWLEDDGYREDSRAKIIDPTWANPAFAGDSVYARDDHGIVRVRVADAARVDQGRPRRP